MHNFEILDLSDTPAEQLADQEQAEFFAELGVPDLTPAERADWDAYLDVMLERLAAVEAEIAGNDAVAQRRIEMIRSWQQSANERLQKEASWLGQRFEQFAAGYDFGRKKSRDLPHGVFGTRSKPETLEITDPAAALAFAKAEGLQITTKESVGKTPLKAYFQASGVVPDGCEYVAASEEFYVKPAGA